MVLAPWYICNMTKTETKEFDGRIGKKMIEAVKYVNKSGGSVPSKNQVATKVGPHGSSQYGYQTVNRCLDRNLLVLNRYSEDAEPRGKGAVEVTDKGLELIGCNETSVSEISGISIDKEDSLKREGYNTVEDVKNANLDEIANIDGIGNALGMRIKAAADDY